MAIDLNIVAKDLLSLIGPEYRKTLDKNIHIVDISYEAFKASDPKLSEEAYLNILSSLAAEYTSVPSVERGMRMVQELGNTVITEDKKYGTFLISESRVPLQSKVSAIIKRTTNAEIGFIPVNTSISSAANKVLSRLPLSASVPVIKELYNLNTEYTEKVILNSKLSADFNKLVGSTTVVVTLSSATRNRQFEVAEKKMLSRISTYLQSSDFVNKLVLEHNIADIVAKNIALAIEKKPLKKTSIKPKAGKATQIKQGKGKLVVDKLPALRNKQGQFYSLASLLVLLNTHLQDVISANMGNGNETKVLNYRTGRFAASAEVQRITQSKTGAITAFYSYMKRPYQTFEPGFKQGSPSSRDPRLLISKSIREIAATKVANRMRSVLV